MCGCCPNERQKRGCLAFPPILLCLPLCEYNEKGFVLEIGKWPSPDSMSASTLNLDFSAFRMVTNFCGLWMSHSVWPFVRTESVHWEILLPADCLGAWHRWRLRATAPWWSLWQGKRILVPPGALHFGFFKVPMHSDKAWPDLADD